MINQTQIYIVMDGANKPHKAFLNYRSARACADRIEGVIEPIPMQLITRDGTNTMQTKAIKKLREAA